MTTPRADRPHVPGYGIPTTRKGMLEWAWADERLARATVYWLATADAAAAPHLIPIWGSWIDGHWYVEGGPTRWQRNLRTNPQAAIKVEFGDEVVSLEGVAREIVAPEPALEARILEGYAKYKPGYVADPANWSAGGLWELRPVKAFAWSVFPKDMTRFTFPDDR